MRRKYLDSMALIERLDKPDLFITMTRNPAWDEIVSELKERVLAQNRSDLTTRLFRSKNESYISSLNKIFLIIQ